MAIPMPAWAHGIGGRSDLPLESVKRVTCDGSIVPMKVDARGNPLDVGRRQRTVPTALKRALWARDKGCSFPGCTHKRFVDQCLTERGYKPIGWK